MKLYLTLPALFTVVLAASALAGESIATGKTALTTPSTSVPLTVLNFRSSYTFESDFERGDAASGDSWFNSASVMHRFPLGWTWLSRPDSGWFFRLGAEYGRFDFNNSGDLPLPETLQNLNGILAIEYLVRGEVSLLLETAPGFYFENDPDSDSFDAPTKLAIAFPLSPRLFVIGGAFYRGQFEKYPVLPVVGVLWRIADDWTLRLIAPSPRLVYRASDSLRLWAGAELSGGSYRVADDDSRPANLRNAVLSYGEIKVGAGFTWGEPSRAALDVGAGYTIRREFDYHRADESYETADGAPYVRVSFTAAF